MARVLVTGVSGFVGLNVAKAAQAAGYSVRGTCRDKAKYADLATVVPGLELAEVDLVDGTPEAWEAAVQGCAFVCHVASPFPIVAPTDEMELITPAVEGTKKVLHACKKAGVRRVVVTSSIASVSSGREDRTEFTTEDWSNLEKCEPYPKSKTMAEKAAREVAAQIGLEICTVNPSYVQGPLLQNRHCSSTKMAVRFLENDMPAVPNIGMNICDVRDVAEAHIKALSGDHGGRYIVDSGPVSMLDVSAVISKEFPDYPVPTFAAPWLLLKLVSLWDKEVAAIMPSWDRKVSYHTYSTEMLLGRPLRSTDEAVVDMCKSLIEFDLVKQPKGRFC